MFRITSIALLTGLILGGCAARQKVATHDRSGAREPISPDAGDLDVPLPCPVDPAEVMFGPVPWAADRGALRWGWGETELTKVQSSMARPIEVCGVRGQLSWLLALSCEDGSHPFPSGDVAHGARV